MEMCVFTLLMCACLSEAFNMDTEHPLVYNGSAADFFGYSVHQSESSTQIIVGAPLARNSTGEIYTCASDLRSCKALRRPDSERVRFFSMSVSVSPDAPLTSCSPYLPHDCDGNSYLNGICYQFNSGLQAVSNFTAAYQECTKREVNLVFLFDGSRSMKPEEFDLNKDFITDIMKKLSNSSIKFAAVQFATTFSTVFDFNDYQLGSAEQKLQKEKHMSALTNTHGAIKYVLENLLNNVSSGANPKAQHALVIITDGDPTDRDNEHVLEKCDKQNILRYIIGVGGLANLARLTSLASEPKHNNTFFIKDYKGLEGLLDNLQKKIYNIEGSTEAHSKDRLKELSQSGFSVINHKDSVIVGSVGSNDWRGSLYEVTGSGSGVKETEIRDPFVSKDSYMGYSAVLGARAGVSFLFSGAPRAEHMGLVTLFIKNDSSWRVSWNISGEQIGSYFGASLSLLDVDSDGDSDFLLVGAPLFHQSQPRAEGKLYVYTFSDGPFQKMLNVSGSNIGRFSASLASLKDLNGDSLSDVAVGAPLENDGEGVVYIYLGDGMRGINLNHAPQRISGRSVLPGLQQFGVSLSGQMDMSDDNLTDVVIGARGGMVLLKARPVMSVSVQLSFSPNEINLNYFECPSDKVLNVFNLTSCFTMKEQTSSNGSLDKKLNVSLELNVDVMRGINRGFFVQRDSSSKALQQLLLLDSGIFCRSFPVFMPGCVADTVSPLKIRMNFSQSEMSGSSVAVLDVYSRTEEYVEVPFQRNCNSNNSCVADLKLDFSFRNNTLVVANQAHFTLLISLENPGDDSFNTSIVLHYPDGLSLSNFLTVKPSRTRSSCGDRDSGATNRTTCSINLPVYRSGTTTQFQATFRVSKWDYDWSDMMEMMITANSDNNGNTSAAAVRRSVPVQFAVDVAISLSAEDSVTYLNFSLEDRGPKPLRIVYKVENLGVKGLPVRVSLHLPCPTTPVRLSKQKFSVQQNSTDVACTSSEDDHCETIECSQFHLDKHSVVQFILTADATFQSVKEYESKFSFQELRKDFSLNISAELNYNRSRYNQTSTGLKDDPHKSQITVKAEFVLPPNRMLIISVGAGGGLILLIIIFFLLVKCGFFKRRRPEEFPSQTDDVSALENSPEDSPLMDTDAKDGAGVAVKENGASADPTNTEQ
ncbi:integrin alpha-D isoform 1 precursor [Danio rerio]|uniref:Integrin alpha-D isoform 1 precursor n=1 Tax=Danio rerio TaxID=7955 RepID=A0AB13A433_DANRE|nr:integrin alpha-D isoform 1 precursor [Danio rerio]|eukprot:XP_005171120.1 integrin alpha-L isoform X1 [Danio rerio]